MLLRSVSDEIGLTYYDSSSVYCYREVWLTSYATAMMELFCTSKKIMYSVKGKRKCSGHFGAIFLQKMNARGEIWNKKLEIKVKNDGFSLDRYKWWTRLRLKLIKWKTATTALPLQPPAAQLRAYHASLHSTTCASVCSETSSSWLQCGRSAHSSVSSGHTVANIDLRVSGRNEEVVLIHQHCLFYFFHQARDEIEWTCDRKCTDLIISSTTLAQCQRTFTLL